MSGTVTACANQVPASCHATRCNKDGCRVGLQGAPRERIIIDMDCEALPIPPNQKRCDYLFVGEESNTTWVAPIELKSGGLKANEVLEQLKEGISMADMLLPQRTSFQFVPVLAHGKGIHRNELKKLRSGKMQLRGQRKGVVLIRCGDPVDQGTCRIGGRPAFSSFS